MESEGTWTPGLCEPAFRAEKLKNVPGKFPTWSMKAFSRNLGPDLGLKYILSSYMDFLALLKWRQLPGSAVVQVRGYMRQDYGDLPRAV